MMNKIQVAALTIVLAFLSTTALAGMHRTGSMGGMSGMSEPGMYNLVIEGLAGRNKANGVDTAFGKLDGVAKVHVDFENGMVMVWVKQGNALDEKVATKIVEEAGFKLETFERPK